MALSTEGTESVCGDNAFPPLLFTHCITYSAIYHAQTYTLFTLCLLSFIYYLHFMCILRLHLCTNLGGGTWSGKAGDTTSSDGSSPKRGEAGGTPRGSGTGPPSGQAGGTPSVQEGGTLSGLGGGTTSGQGTDVSSGQEGGKENGQGGDLEACRAARKRPVGKQNMQKKGRS